MKVVVAVLSSWKIGLCPINKGILHIGANGLDFLALFDGKSISTKFVDTLFGATFHHFQYHAGGFV